MHVHRVVWCCCLLQVDAFVVVVVMGVGTCPRVRGDVCSFVTCRWWPDVTGHCKARNMR